MIWIRLLRYLRGTMEFQVEGKYLERFLNLAARAGIPIWDGNRTARTFCGKTLSSHAGQLRQIAEKVGIQWQETRRFGAPKLRFRYRKRVGIGAGALLMAGLMILSEQFVWTIEVKGNEIVSDAQVIHTAEQLGLHRGVWKDSLDVIRIGDGISVELEEVSWAAVNLLGTVAEIEIVERVMTPELLDEESPCNVVAEKAGQIVELEVYEGEKMVKIGDTVTQGGLIASGILQDKHGRTIYRHARARAVVEYKQTETVEIPLSSTELAASGNHENSYRLLFAGASIPLTFGSTPSGSEFSTEAGLVESGIYHNEEGEQWFYWVRNQPLKLLGYRLPLTIQIQQYIPAQPVELNYTAKQAKDLAILNMDQIQRKLENQEIEVVDRELRGAVRGTKFVLTADFLCREEIAKEVEILRQS